MCAVVDELPTIAEDDERLNSILRDWHRWASDERTALGYPTVSTSCKFYRASRQHDDLNGALDQDVENVVMAGVDACVNEIVHRAQSLGYTEREALSFRNAVSINARNLSTGLAVWRSPRLPDDEFARALMVSDARAILLTLLRERGLI